MPWTREVHAVRSESENAALRAELMKLTSILRQNSATNQSDL